MNTSTCRRFGFKSCIGVALATALAASPAISNAYSLDFELVNRTNQPIIAMWAVPTGSSTWGPAFDNTFVPQSGGRQRVHFTQRGSDVDACTYSVKVQFSEGAARYWTNVNLCSTHGMQVFVANGEVKATTW